MILFRVLLVIGISVAALLISITLDFLCASLPTFLQFMIQIPVLVLSLEEARRWILAHIHIIDQTLTIDDINSSFFFAAPIAAFGSMRLFQSLERGLKLHQQSPV